MTPMHKQIYQKVLFHLSLFGIGVSILTGFYDLIFGSLWEFIHIIFEVVELGLDKLIEHIFETGLHETQLIVFYILLTIGGVLIYFLWKALVHFADLLKLGFKDDWSEFKEAATTDWGAMSLANRVILIVVFLLLNYLATFLLF